MTNAATPIAHDAFGHSIAVGDDVAYADSSGCLSRGTVVQLVTIAGEPTVFTEEHPLVCLGEHPARVVAVV